MNILMCGDNSIIKGMEMVIYSTMKFNKDVHWYIFTMNYHSQNCHYDIISAENIAFLKKIIAYFDPRSTLNIIDVSQYHSDYLKGNQNDESNFSPYTNLRLIADVALPLVSDILYLDCDVAVQEDLHNMYYDYLSQGYEYCAYSAAESHAYQGEMVAGILLLNLDKIRQTGLFVKARKNLFEKHYTFPDQQALTEAGDPFPLPETFNYIYNLNYLQYKPAIVHFTAFVGGKIYKMEEHQFYLYFPSFTWIRDGLNLIRSIQGDLA